MRRGLKYAMMRPESRERSERDYGREDMPRSYRGGDIENRFRDRRGREHYDNGRYAPMRSEYSGGGYDSRRDDEGYENRRGNGGRRYSPARSEYHEYDDGGEDYYPYTNKIGFSIDGEMDRLPERGMEPIPFPTNKHHREGGELTKAKAMEWARGMKNDDGSTGAHWNLEQTTQVMNGRGWNCDPLEFYLVMNMMYSDYDKIFRKYGVNKPEFYAELAKAWLDDPDAKKNKTLEYFSEIVKH